MHQSCRTLPSQLGLLTCLPQTACFLVRSVTLAGCSVCRISRGSVNPVLVPRHKSNPLKCLQTLSCTISLYSTDKGMQEQGVQVFWCLATSPNAYCRALKHGADGGLQEQVVEILRLLLDPESMDQTSERSEFLEVFYDKYIQQLIGLLEGKGRSGPKRLGSSSVLGKRREREDDSGEHLGSWAGQLDSILPAHGTGLLQQHPSPAHFYCCAGAPDHAGSHAALPNGILPANGHATPRESPSAAAGAQQPQTENGTSGTGPDAGTPSAAQQSAEPEDSRSETVRPSTLGLIVDLLCFCVQHHSFRIKYYTLRNNVVEKVGRNQWQKFSECQCACQPVIISLCPCGQQVCTRLLMLDNPASASQQAACHARPADTSIRNA